MSFFYMKHVYSFFHRTSLPATLVMVMVAAVLSFILTGCGGMNGQYIEPRRGAVGLCSLIISNNYSDDIVVKLYEVKNPTECLHFMYVSAKDDATIEGIAPGNFMLRYSKGKDWDPSTKMFAHERANFETDQVFKMEETETKTETSDGTRTEKHWSVHSFILNPSGGDGNSTISQIDDAEFK